MGSVQANYCDSCGANIGGATLVDAVQIVTVGSSGDPIVIYLCCQREEMTFDNVGRPVPGKITGCGRKVLTKSVLAKLYEEVAEYTGDENVKPFSL